MNAPSSIWTKTSPDSAIAHGLNRSELTFAVRGAPIISSALQKT